MVTRVDEHWLEDNQRELGQVYNRLQESHQIIGELVGLLKDALVTEHPRDLMHLRNEIKQTIKKYGDINGD